MCFEFVPVESSTIAGIGYHEAEHTLYVRFKNGSVWRYFNVMPTRHKSFMESESKGHFFAQLIKPKYDGEQTKMEWDKPEDETDDHGMPIEPGTAPRIGPVKTPEPIEEKPKGPRPAAPVRVGSIDL